MKVYTAPSTSELSSLVASLISDNPLSKTAVFCEDKFTLSLELAIAKKHGGTFGVNVYSFNRFMHKFLPEDKKCLSQESCALVVKRLLLENKSDLTCFKNVYDPNLASAVYELIAQLKSAKVTVSDITRARDESIGNLKRKLKDIALIFEKYEEFLVQNSLTDGNNRLYRLPDFFENDPEIKQTKVIIAGFPSLNKTLCEIFKALVKNAKEVCFAVVAGDNKNLYTNETFNFAMKEFAPEMQEQKTFEVKQKLLDTLFVPGLKIEKPFETEAIYHFKAKNPNEEIEKIAKYVKKAVINGARYKDFALTCENVSNYELIVKRIFHDYEIPYFFDGKRNLGQHPLTRLTCAYIDVVRTNFDTEKVLTFVKNPLFCPDKNLADGFENYYISYAINRKTVKEPFAYEDKHVLEYEILRTKLCNVCTFLKSGLTFEQTVHAIRKMIETLNAFELTEKLSSALENLNSEQLYAYNSQGKDGFEKVLTESVNLLGEQVFPLVEVKNIILSGMTACEVFLIPERNDCVFVGDFRSVKYGNYNTLFAMGLTSDVPSSKLDTALLCDRDIDKMKSCEVLVEPKIKEVNRRSRETACMALASFNNRLIVSYCTTGKDGKQLLPSESFERIKKVFCAPEATKRTVQSFEDLLASDYLTNRCATLQFAKQVNFYKEGKEESRETFKGATAYYSVVKEKGESAQNEKVVLDAFLNSANTEIGYYTEGVNYAEKGLSATTIEGYFSCPYKNFLQRGLKLEEVKSSRIMSNDLGTMVHAVAEEFVKEANFNGDISDAIELASAKFEQIVGNVQYSRYLKSAEGRKSFELIKKECLRFCGDLFMGVKNSSFKPSKTEIAFGFKGYPPIKIKTKHGEKNVTGMVDRLDVFNKNMRIIDYKTGLVEEEDIEKNLYVGEKLQLFLYAKAFENKYKPVGVYYFPIADGFVKPNESAVMSLKGRTIADVSVVRELDYSVTDDNLKGTFIDVSIKTNKKGEFSSKKLFTPEQFTAFSNYATAVAGNALEEINDGVIVASPSQGACVYCKFHGICGYDKTDNKTREVSGIDKNSIVSAVEYERELTERQNQNQETKGDNNE